MDSFPTAGSVSLLAIVGGLATLVSLVFLIIALVKAFRLGCGLGLICLLIPFAILIVAFIKREEMGKAVLISIITGIIGFGAFRAAAEQLRANMEAEIQKKMPSLVAQMTKEMQKNAPPQSTLPKGQPQNQPAQQQGSTATSNGVVDAAQASLPGNSGRIPLATAAAQSQPVILAGPQEKFVKSFHAKLTAMSTDLNNQRPQAGASAEEIAKFNAKAAVYANLLKEYKNAVADLEAARAREAAQRAAAQSDAPIPVR
jgi:hypothetical protein